ncbi:MAG: hypothetical protein HC902_01305 [Calothrix sp. SM1_5_4]|nr:hypothetical protein [Calothrix sp. SM1_5_4]
MTRSRRSAWSGRFGRLPEFDLVLYVVDSVHGIDADENAFWTQVPWSKTAILLNKIDLNPNFGPPLPGSLSAPILRVSAATSEGLLELRKWLGERVRSELSEDSALLSNARHFEGLEILRGSLEKALPLVLNGESPDLIALELQSGLRALYEILGLVYDDQVMDRVFSEFCLGK